MNEAPLNSFKTKTGTCTITSERIILTREGVRGAAAKHIHGNNIRRSLVIYSLLGIAAIGLAAMAISNNDYVLGGFMGIISLAFLWSVLSSRGFSAAPVIERVAIKSVEAHSPRPPLTRGYFVVKYIENGKERKRLIMLPALFGGKSEYQRALLVMDKSGLLVRNQGT